MAWFRMLPSPLTSGVSAQGVPGLYCNNSAQPAPGKGLGSMGRGRTPEKRARWKMQYMRNRQSRSEFNSEFRGENGNRRAAEYHERIKAFSCGSA